MQALAYAVVEDQEPELELIYELVVDDEHDIELLDDAWFNEEVVDEAYEIDPVHPLRRLGSWIRGITAA